MMVTHTVVEWQIETEVLGDQHKHIVYRKDADFYHLRSVLLALYPYTMIPALPQKNKSTTDEYLNELMKLYNRFLTSVCRSEVLKTCKLVQSFLQHDSKFWNLEKLKYDKAKFTRNISDVVSKDGVVNLAEKK